MKKYQAVLFDMDGVLLDSERVYYDIRRRVLDSMPDIKNKLPMSFESMFVACLGMTREEENRWLLQHCFMSEADVLAFWKQVERQYDEYIADHIFLPAMANIVPTVQRIAQMGLKTVVVSGSKENYVREYVHMLQLPFYTIVCGNHVANSKPHHESYTLAANRICTYARDCLVVEDSPNGIAAAYGAHMDSVLLLSDYIEPFRYAIPATYQIKTVTELIDIITDNER